MNKEIITQRFDELVEHITAAEWFTDAWGIYRSGNYIHIYKETWYDDNHHGVHFETYIEDGEIESGSFPLVIHAEGDTPNRDHFVKEVIEVIKDRIPAHMLGENDYTIYKEMITLDAETLVSDVLASLEELQFVVPVIDMCLEEK